MKQEPLTKWIWGEWLDRKVRLSNKSTEEESWPKFSRMVLTWSSYRPCSMKMKTWGRDSQRASKVQGCSIIVWIQSLERVISFLYRWTPRSLTTWRPSVLSLRWDTTYCQRDSQWQRCMIRGNRVSRTSSHLVMFVSHFFISSRRTMELMETLSFLTSTNSRWVH